MMERIGEVVQSNTAFFSAVIPVKFLQTGSLPVRFGDLVKVGTGIFSSYAIVSFIEHIPTEPNRKVSPHGKDREELRREMPQVFELLQTSFNALIVGFEENGSLRQSTPPVPPSLHDFVYQTTEDERTRFFSKKAAYIRMIMQSRDVMPDELIIAFLRSHLGVIEQAQLVAIGKELSYLLGDDHRRLESVLERIFD
ncbi:MAG: hypothetical protein HGB11_04880 [Chlorobiales bacterium]|nr:hypothetical protein [Chlorobiales bacterium]